MWILFGITFASMALASDAVRLHPTGKSPLESPKVSRPFLKLLCEGKIVNGSEEFARMPVCSAPPAFVGQSALPGQFGIHKIYFGHFTSPTADEALLATSGGEPHAANFGGTV